MSGKTKFYRVVRAAIKDLAEHGYDDAQRVARWQAEIRKAAEAMLEPQDRMAGRLRRGLRAMFARLVDRGEVLGKHPGVERFTLEKLRPELTVELDRRIMASANLIKLNREEEISKTLRRFSGWATSIPAGGSEQVDQHAEAEKLRKSMSGLSFRERRVLIDQGHKLTTTVSEIIATDTGAIAAIWHSHWRQQNYDYRETHRDRDEVIYVVRDNWAIKKGLMKLSGRKFTDDVTKPGEEVYCRCYYEWLYNLRDLPQDMITEKGKQALARVRRAA